MLINIHIYIYTSPAYISNGPLTSTIPGASGARIPVSPGPGPVDPSQPGRDPKFGPGAGPDPRARARARRTPRSRGGTRSGPWAGPQLRAGPGPGGSHAAGAGPGFRARGRTRTSGPGPGPTDPSQLRRHPRFSADPYAGTIFISRFPRTPMSDPRDFPDPYKIAAGLV